MATFLEGSVPVSLEDVLVFFTGSDKKKNSYWLQQSTEAVVFQ